MSVIGKMSVMGIRSFGPDDTNKQLIEFFTPLTLILGPNGSGKTTIIECLRYMTTGDPPPNSDRGGSFVHDPKIARETEVRGQIRLQLTDVLGKKVVASRSLLATQKQKKIQLKTLEGTITRVGVTGEKINLSSKCAEIDSEMISSLGVSKAILNNVIFCHQEESNWPLSEGKTLKQKFDDIFAATRYIKALDEIRKTRLAKMNDVKIYKTEVEYLKSNSKKAAEHSQDLEKTQSRLAACRDTILQIEKKLDPVMGELDEISVKENKIGALEATLESKKVVMLKLENNHRDLKNSIKNIFVGTKEGLEEEMDNFQSSMSQKKKRLDKVKAKWNDMESKQRNLQKRKSEQVEELGKLKMQHKQHKDRISQRDSMISEMSKQLGLGEVDTECEEGLRNSQIENVIRNWKQRNNMTHHELKDSKKKHELKESEVQAQIDKVRDIKSQLDQKFRSSMEQVSKNKNTINNIKAELSFVDSLANKQDDLEQEIKEIEEELVSREGSLDVDDLRKKIVQWQKQRGEISAKLSALNAEMSKLQNESKTRTEIDLIMKDKETKVDSINKLRDRHKETVIHLLGELPSQNAQDAVKKLMNSLSHVTQTMSKDLEKKRSQLSSLKTTKKLQSEELRKLEDSLSSQKSKIFQVCGSQNFDEGLDVLEKTVKELQEEKGALTGSLYIYNKYVEKLSTPKPCCPLCSRDFAADEEARSLVRDLQRKLQMVPSQLDKKERAIAEHQHRLNNMLGLRPLKETIEKLEDKEIPELRKKISDVSQNIDSLTTEISDVEEELDNKLCDSKTASSILPDLIILDQNQRDLDRHERRLNFLAHQLGADDLTRTIEQVSDEQASFQTQLESMQQQIDRNQQRLSHHVEQIQHLRGRINELKSEKVEIASKLQKQNSLKDQLANLNQENNQLTVTAKGAKGELIALEKQLQDLIREKDTVLKAKEVELDEIRKKIMNQEKEMDQINGLSTEITRYINAGKEGALVAQENTVQSITADIKKNSNDISELTSICNNLNEEITSQQLKYREYEDNKKLMEILEEIKTLKEESRRLKEKIGGFNIRSLHERKRSLMDEVRKLTKERDESEGRQGELKNQVKKLNELLNDKMFKDADKKYRHKAIELRTTELACGDLNKYYVALDRAIMTYHKMKMEEINKIIRELWIKTYSGSDIDYIEIRSSEDESEAGLEKAKRTYNYKVVMVKGDTATDMRGRCSAGQKVLASLMIRLALAETFCLNCGILALDEPTTNLDRDNISSLARALVEIVQSRSEQRNFQLIIITHDEDFIELLGRSDVVDYFYRVSKDNNGYSKLAKCFISEMA